MLKRTFLQAYAILPTMEYRARHLSERDLGLYRKNLERELQNERRQQKRLLSKDSMATEDSLTDVTIMISPLSKVHGMMFHMKKGYLYCSMEKLLLMK